MRNTNLDDNSTSSPPMLASVPGPLVGSSDGEEDASAKFHRLVQQWKDERGPSSSVRRMAAHPAYRGIVAIGQAAIPLLLAELNRQPDHWFIALHELTGADPVPKESRGRIGEMAAAWIRWGKENGFVS